MVWQTILCVLAALGLVLVLWVFLGAWLLPLRPKHGEVMLLWRAAGDDASMRKTREALIWLQESGLAPRTLVLWDDGLTPEARQTAAYIARADPRVRLVDGTATLESLRESSTDGRRTDDPAGRGERRSLSER